MSPENLGAAQLRFQWTDSQTAFFRGVELHSRLGMTEAVLASTGDEDVPHVLAELPSRRWAHRMLDGRQQASLRLSAGVS